MLDEIRTADVVRSLIVHALVFLGLGLVFYHYGWFTMPYGNFLFAGSLAILVAGGIYGIFALNATRRNDALAAVPAAEKQHRDVQTGRTVVRLAGIAVILGLTVQLVIKLWPLIYR